MNLRQPNLVSRRHLFRVVLLGTGAAAVTAACGQAAPIAGSPPTPGAAAATALTVRPTAATTAATAPTAGAAATPTIAALSTSAQQIPRNQTLVFSVSDSLNEMTDQALANPFVTGIQRTGWQFAFEPLYFFNQHWTSATCGPPGMPCKNGEIPWLAEGYSYNQDYTELTIKVRPKVTWSDGQPFTASDIAFTLNMLKDNAPKLLFSVDMKLWVKEAVALDPLTAKVTLNNPNPRFMFFYLMHHDDLGFPMVPEHIFKAQDPTTFTNLDLAKGWPVVTGPWRLTLSGSLQKFWDRRDDWWAATTGFHRLPSMRRIIVLPSFEDSKRLELLLTNQVDSTHDMQVPNAKAALAGNPKLKVWTTNNAPPLGCIDAWTNAMSFNCSKPPFNDSDLRWAVNYALDRKQVVNIGYQGAGQGTLLPFPEFPVMEPYFQGVQDILQKYPVGTTDLAKSAQLMQAKGYAKDSGGFWAKGGKRLSMVIITIPGFFEDITPIIIAQLRKAGFAASFKAPSNDGTIEALGQEDAFINGITGSVRDPYETLSFYHSRYIAPTGQTAPQPYRWKNTQFDQTVDGMAATATDDPKLMTLYHSAMELWLKDLPSIPTVQWFIRIPMNNTYWTGWPSEKNPYIEPSNWHRTVPLFINSLQPA